MKKIKEQAKDPNSPLAAGYMALVFAIGVRLLVAAVAGV